MINNSNFHYAGTKRMHNKKMISVLLSVIMLIGCFGAGVTAFAASDIASGNVTETISWKIDSSGILRVSGAGAIPDYDFLRGKTTAPWFDYKDKITGIIVGEGVTKAGEFSFAFFNKTNNRLTQLSFPSTLKKIGQSAFCETYFDCNLVIPDSVTAIESCAFQCNYGAFKGHTLKLSSNLTRIEGHTFMNCGFTGALTLPNGLTGIYDDETSNLNDSYAFGGNDFTGTLIIPASVAYIGKSAFASCGFSKIQFASDSQLQHIGDYAFYENHNLRGTLSLPNGLKTIGAYAFEDCTSCSDDSASANQGLTGNLVIPASVTSIGERAFACNYWLNGRLTINNANASIGKCAFHGCSVWSNAISTFYQNKTDLVYVKRGFLMQGKDGKLDSNTAVEDPSEYYYYLYCSGCDDVLTCTTYNNISGLVDAGRLRSARSISLTSNAAVQDEALPVYEYVDRIEPTYDTTGVEAHYIDDNRNCFLPENSVMVQVSEDSLVIPALVRIENVLVPEEIDVTVGKTAEIELNVQPENASLNGVSFASSDGSIATVNSLGVIKGVSVGETTVTVNIPDGASETISVVVLEKAQKASFFDLISDFFDSIISFFLNLFSFNR